MRRRIVLTRRLVLQSAVAAAGLAALSGCSRRKGPELLATAGALPKPWVSALPKPWSLREDIEPQQIARALEQSSSSLALVALSDGWASTLNPKLLQPLQAPKLLARLNAAAASVSRLYGAPDAVPLAYPWAFSPWVLALRNHGELLQAASQSWQVLLDPRLKGMLVLPSSPRISIELMGADPNRLRQLRRQALAYDDAQGLNLLLNGDARAAVLPLQRLIPLLRRDPRLQVALPASGAPLSWQLLLQPAACSTPLPLSWMQQILQPPVLNSALRGGWVPPLPRSELDVAAAGLPPVLRALLLPPDAVLQRCWSLPPLPEQQRLLWQTLWDSAAP